MPFYKWTGINLYGEIVHGKNFAKNENALENDLLAIEVGLIKKNKIITISEYFITREQINNFLYNIAVLIKSGVRLYPTLKTIEISTKNFFLKSVIEQISKDILNGAKFSHAICYYPTIFDQLTLTLIQSGEQTGNLADILLNLCTHQKEISLFKKKTINSLVIPMITFGCFVLIALAIFIFVIPRIADILISFNKPIEKFTQNIIDLSNFICSLNLLKFILAILTLAIIIYNSLKIRFLRFYIEKNILKIPIIGKLIKANYYTYFLQTLTVLIIGNINLSQSLELIAKSIKNNFISKQIESISNAIKSGRSLTQALKESSFFNTHNLTALIYIGESSSELSIMLKQANNIYQTYFYQALNNISNLIQPILIIILALLIAGLIASVYLPIFSISEIV